MTEQEGVWPHPPALITYNWADIFMRRLRTGAVKHVTILADDALATSDLDMNQMWLAVIRAIEGRKRP